MFDRLFAYLQASRENRRLAAEFAGMTHRDFVDIGISSADVPNILEENFRRLFDEAFAARTAARGARVGQRRAA